MPAQTQPMGAELSNPTALTFGKQRDMEGRRWEPAMKVPANLIQLATCKAYYGDPGAVTRNLTNDRTVASALLKANLVSWTGYLIDKVKEVANELFSTEQEVAWWGNWAAGLVVDLIDDAIPKPIGTLIKAFASVGEHIAGNSIADARKKLASKGTDAVIIYRTNQKTAANAYIKAHFKKLQGSDEDCEGKQQALVDHINKEWPFLDTAALPQAKKLAKRLMTEVKKKERLEKAKRSYEECVRMELFRPGGIPSPEEERKAREDCRKRTGYSPITAC